MVSLRLGIGVVVAVTCVMVLMIYSCLVIIYYNASNFILSSLIYYFNIITFLTFACIACLYFYLTFITSSLYKELLLYIIF